MRTTAMGHKSASKWASLTQLVSGGSIFTRRLTPQSHSRYLRYNYTKNHKLMGHKSASKWASLTQLVSGGSIFTRRLTPQSHSRYLRYNYTKNHKLYRLGVGELRHYMRDCSSSSPCTRTFKPCSVV